MEKYLSRKFILAVAAFVGSLGASISGLVIGNTDLTTVGVIMCAFSAAIYAAAEAYVDAADVSSKQQVTSVTAQSGNNVKLVEKILTGTNSNDNTAE